MKGFSDTTKPDSFVTNTFPFLAYLTQRLQWWRPHIRHLMEQRDLWMTLLDGLKAKMAAGKGPKCLARDFLTSTDGLKNVDDEQMAFLAGTMIEAGSETTSSAINTAILYLAANPDIQKRVQAELDQHVSAERTPVLSDASIVPLISAVVKETFRLRFLTRYGTLHYTLAPTTYRSRKIPAGTFLVLKQAALHFDLAHYADPEAFSPERYLGHPHSSATYAAMADVGQRDHYNFGAGRRLCPGIYLAENSVAVALAKLLWAFDIAPASAASGGQDIDSSDVTFCAGANTVPKPFSVRFFIQDGRRADAARREWARAAQDGYEIRGAPVNQAGVLATA